MKSYRLQRSAKLPDDPAEEKGPHSASLRCEKACMPLPQRSKGSALKDKVLFIANSATVARTSRPYEPCQHG